jgi:t-SNARE complex subunit (syntaxin)
MFTRFDRRMLTRVEAKLDALLKGGTDEGTKEELDNVLNAIKEQENEMADLTQAIGDLATKVTEQKTVIDGVTVAIQELTAQLTTAAGDLSAEGEQAAADKLNEIAAALSANTDALAVAIAKNTDANDEVHAAGM